MISNDHLNSLVDDNLGQCILGWTIAVVCLGLVLALRIAS